MKKIKTPTIVTVAITKGGVGKTTTLCNLAVALSKEIKTTVIDIDHKQKHTTKFNKKRAARGESFNLKEVNNEEEFINFLQTDDSLTLIDTGATDSTISRTALMLSDYIIIPVGKSSFELEGLKDMVNILKMIYIKRKDLKCKLLVNRVAINDKNTHKELKKYVKQFEFIDIFKTIIPNNVKYERMLDNGESITEISNGTPSIMFNELLKEVKKDLGVNDE